MTVNNFAFLKDRLPELETLGSFAEQYVLADPSSCGVKLRTFGEELVKIIYQHLNLTQPDDDSFFGLLDNETFKEVLPNTIISKLHRLRKLGNKSAHGSEVKPEESLDILREAHDLGKWIIATLHNEDISIIPKFVEPKNGKSKDEWDREKNQLLRELYKKETRVEELLDELKSARAAAESIKRTPQELNILLQKGFQVANELKFDEATTRRLLIDDQLVTAGWKVGSTGNNTSEVTQEEPIENQPTETGVGYADYVLWDDDGKPLAVIEAKKTAKDANLGKKQAVLYADGLEKKHGKRPVIFYTNGYDIYIWNDVAKEPPRQI